MTTLWRGTVYNHRRLSTTLLALTLAVGACSKPAAPGATPRPADATPTPHPWTIGVTSAKATTRTTVGGDFTMTVELANTGTVASKGTKFQLGDIKDYADVAGCTPGCDVASGLGDVYLELPGIAAGGTLTVSVELVPTKVGAAHWSLCVYDDVGSGDQVYCGEGTVTIR